MQFCIYLSEHSLLDVAKIGSHFVHVVPPRFACDFFAAIGFRWFMGQASAFSEWEHMAPVASIPFSNLICGGKL